MTLYNPVNICRGDDSDIISFVLSNLLTFLTLPKVRNRLHFLMKVMASTPCIYDRNVSSFQWTFTLPLSNENL